MDKQKKFAVVLSGCGVFDGSEIHETVMTLYAIVKHGGKYELFAPDIPHYHVINHIKGQESGETRNVLVESARIGRGNVKPLSKFDATQYDGLIFPGGFGAAKNLSDYAFKRSNCTVNKEVSSAINTMVKLKKPIGALCIAPVIIAKVLGHVKLTVGSDSSTINELEAMGATHQVTTHGEVVVDDVLKVVSSPCYMLDANIVQIEKGTENVVINMMKLMD